MRYQRVSPDCVPLSNGKKPNHENGRSMSNGFNAASISFENKGFRFRSPSKEHHQSSIASTPQHSDSNHNQTRRQESSSAPSPSRAGSGDMLLQWGQKKRTRVSRSEIRGLVEESSSSRQPLSKSRRVDGSKLSPPSMPPPPPPPPPPPTQQPRGANFKKENSTLLSHRNAEKQSVAGNGSPLRNSGCGSKVTSRSTIGKRYPPTPDATERKTPSSRSNAKDEKPNESTAQADHVNRANSAPSHSEQEAVVANNCAPAVEKVNNAVEATKWPRIYLALSRREKEDDFFAINGTKLPQRPKKRAKNIDKALKYCYPGMWLSDLTKSRYEVREKKCVKKVKPSQLYLKSVSCLFLCFLVKSCLVLDRA